MEKVNLGLCDACGKEPAKEVASVPMVPCSVAYCSKCLQANNHPMAILIANTVCIDGLKNSNDAWKNMVTDSLKYQEKTLEWCNDQVYWELKHAMLGRIR